MTNETQSKQSAENSTAVSLKEIKLQLPLRTHVRLRAGKLLHGDTIAMTVTAAVTAYFERNPVRDAFAPDVESATA